MTASLSPQTRRLVDRATELGLHPEVRERPDGVVEVLVQHPTERHTWVQWMQYGPRRGRWSHYANHLPGPGHGLRSLNLKQAQFLLFANWVHFTKKGA